MRRRIHAIERFRVAVRHRAIFEDAPGAAQLQAANELNTAMIDAIVDALESKGLIDRATFELFYIEHLQRRIDQHEAVVRSHQERQIEQLSSQRRTLLGEAE